MLKPAKSDWPSQPTSDLAHDYKLRENPPLRHQYTFDRPNTAAHSFGACDSSREQKYLRRQYRTKLIYKINSYRRAFNRSN